MRWRGCWAEALAEPRLPTWNAAAPPVLGVPGPALRWRGRARMAAFLGLTLVALAAFLLARGVGLAVGPAPERAVTRVWARGALALMGLRARAVGAPIPRGAMVANHSSWIDILVLLALAPVRFVSKADVAAWPGVGLLARLHGTVFIERRRLQAKAQEAQLRAAIGRAGLVCLFPEGTSTDGLRVLPFKSTLFSAFFDDGAGMAVQPVSLRYTAAPNLPVAFYGWWGTMGFGAHIWQVLCRSQGGEVVVTFHPATRAADWPDRKALADHCTATVTAAVAA